MTRDMVLSRLPDTTAPSQIEHLSHVPPAIISQESHFLGDNIVTLPSNVRQTRPLASQPVSFYQEEIHTFHGSAYQCIDPPKSPSLPRNEGQFAHAISNFASLCPT